MVTSQRFKTEMPMSGPETRVGMKPLLLVHTHSCAYGGGFTGGNSARDEMVQRLRAVQRCNRAASLNLKSSDPRKTRLEGLRRFTEISKYALH